MTTSYPASLDSYTNPAATDELDDEIGTRTHSEFHADNNDAIEAIQTELGTDPKGAAASVKARIAATETVANAALPTATAATTYQPLASGLTTLAANITAFGHSLVDDADASAARTTLGLVIGTNVQAQDAELSAIAGLTSASDALPYFTGSGTAAVTTLTAAARTVLDDTTVGAMLATMGGAPLASPTFTGVVTVAAGTAAAPAITFTGDTNTGIYSDSADTVKVTTGGTLRATFGSTTNLLLQAGSATDVPLVAKGAASQSGSLQQWQDSTGTVLASVSASGNSFMRNTYAFTVQDAATNVGPYIDLGGTTVLLQNRGDATYRPLIVRGMAAQSGALTQWQDSAGSVLASVSSAGLGSFAGVTLTDATNLVVGSTTGSKIGTATTQKLGFWNATPAVQPTNVTNPTGGATVDAEARTAIDAILSRLETIGLFAA